MLTEKRFLDISSRFAGRTIAVIGDFFLDRYLFFDDSQKEISAETGLFANQVIKIIHSPGAAGNIAVNLKALGAGTVIPVGYTGDDGEGYELRQDIRALGCGDDYLLTFPERHTCFYAKPQNKDIRGLAGEKERYDFKNRTPFTQDEEQSLTEAAEAAVRLADGVIVADQSEVDREGCGVVTPGVRRALISLAAKHPEKLFWVDSRLRGDRFRNMILKPNAKEAVWCALGKTVFSEEDINAAGRILSEKNRRPVFLTLAEKGIRIFDGDRVTGVPAVRVEGETDPTGAGDSVTAAAVLALLSGANFEEAARTGCLAAAVTVRQLGRTGSATPEDIAKQIAAETEI